MPIIQPMENTINLVILLLLLTFLSSWLVLDYLYAPKHHPKEPPVVPSSIPYIGHILGLLRHGSKYYQTTRYHVVASCAVYFSRRLANDFDP